MPKPNIQQQNCSSWTENKSYSCKKQSSDLAELDEIVKSMMEKSENKCGNPNDNRKADLCKVCGKEGKGSHIKDHIEANHTDGIALPCNICEKTFRSRHSLRDHHSRHKCTRL